MSVEIATATFSELPDGEAREVHHHDQKEVEVSEMVVETLKTSSLLTFVFLSNPAPIHH
jgi:hypothetical protein